VCASAAVKRRCRPQSRGRRPDAARRTPAGNSGFEVLRIVKENYSLVEVVMISASSKSNRRAGDEARRLSLRHEGFRLRPAAVDRQQASDRQDLNRQVLTLSAQVADQTEREFVVGPSKMTRDIVDLVRRSRSCRDGADPGRERHGQGAAGAADHREAGDPRPFIAVNLAAISARAGGKRTVRFTSAARSPARTVSSSENSSSRRTARCSSTKSAICGGSAAKLLRAIQEGRSSASAGASRSRPSSG